MSSMKSSATYIWSTNCVLGKGATGAVYKGIQKSTGDPVAVKTFNQLSHLRPYEVQMREFEVLKKVNHENIVKLLAVEEEVDTRSKVLVMELCTGGSLFSILDDPKNSYGLDEEEFLLVLSHLSAGMKHLRDNNIIHRDLKPGNIMKYIAEDGSCRYKLTDFGAARELEDDQQFMSLYGTEEYLHPDMYERAVLHHVAGKSFPATVDLWSIGATLYHVASGSLPFRPYGGRKNKDIMHRITTKKASGVISGVQLTENGPIDWHRELPQTCLLSDDLKKLVTPVLAGVLESDTEKMWTFEKFFNGVTEILNNRRFHLFHVNESQELSIYFPPNKTISEFKQYIHSRCGIPIDQQLILFKKQALHIKDSSAWVMTLPQTTFNSPYLLLQRDHTEVKFPSVGCYRLPRFPTVHMGTLNLEHDAAVAKSCASVGHAVERLVVKLVCCHDQLRATPCCLMPVIQENIELLRANFKQAMASAVCFDKTLQLFVTLTTWLLEFLHHWPGSEINAEELQKLLDIVSDRQQNRSLVNQRLTSIQRGVKSLEVMLVQLQDHLQHCISLKGSIETAETYVQKIRESWQALFRDKNLRSLSCQDEQFHILEKLKIKRTNEKMLALVQDKCIKVCEQLAAELDIWYSGANGSMVQYICLQEELCMVNNMLQAQEEALKKDQEKCEGILNKLTTAIRSSKEGTSELDSRQSVEKKNKTKKTALPLLVKELHELKESHSGLWSIVQEHSSMINEFNTLTAQLRYMKLDECSDESDGPAPGDALIDEKDLH